MSSKKGTCKVCNHNDVVHINKCIYNNDTVSSIAKRWGMSRGTINKHRDVCLAKEINQKKDIIEQLTSNDRLKAYEDRFDKTNKMIEAVDRWMTDPDNPGQYTIDDRANEIDVIYQEWDKENGRLKQGKMKATLQDLLTAVDSGGFMVREITSRRVDPRKLLLESLKEEREMIKMIMDLTQKAREWEFKNRKIEDEKTSDNSISFEKQIDLITERVTIARQESNSEELSKLAGLPKL